MAECALRVDFEKFTFKVLGARLRLVSLKKDPQSFPCGHVVIRVASGAWIMKKGIRAAANHEVSTGLCKDSAGLPIGPEN